MIIKKYHIGVWMGLCMILFFCFICPKSVNAATDLRKCKVLSYQKEFTYSGGQNIPKTITITTPILKQKKTLHWLKDYDFMDWEEKNISKLGGQIILKGLGKYCNYMKIKINVKNGTIRVASYENPVISQKKFSKKGTYTFQIKKPKIYAISKDSIPKYKYRLSNGNSKNIAITSDGKVTLKSNKKATYTVDCLISAYKYNTCKRPIKIVVK